MSERNPYEVLGVKPTASADEIKAAHRRLVRELHPDVSDAADAADRFAEVQRAYALLSNPEKRRDFDRFGHAGPRSARGGARAHSRSWSAPDTDEFGDLFDAFFNSARRTGRPGERAGGHARPRAGRNGEDVEAALTIDFETAARGGERELSVPGRSGRVVVRLPRGIADGTKLRVAGQGHPAPAARGGVAGRSGDLLVTVRVSPHPVWSRRKTDDGRWSLDLEMDLPITFAEAVDGAQIDVPTPEGVATVRLPQGTKGGSSLRLKGRGLSKKMSGSGDSGAGDLFLRVRVIPPPGDALDDDTRAVLRALSDQTPTGRDGPHWPEGPSSVPSPGEQDRGGSD